MCSGILSRCAIHVNFCALKGDEKNCQKRSHQDIRCIQLRHLPLRFTSHGSSFKEGRFARKALSSPVHPTVEVDGGPELILVPRSRALRSSFSLSMFVRRAGGGASSSALGLSPATQTNNLTYSLLACFQDTMKIRAGRIICRPSYCPISF